MGFLNFTPETLIASLVAVLVAMTVHEFAHCWVADRMGDPTPRAMGRLTLNPVAHIDWLGFILFVVIGFGFLGSAPISPHRMRNPRWGGIAAIAAGPVANLLLAGLFAILYRLLVPGFVAGSVPELLMLIVITSVSINIVLFLFNLIPLYPLDGWRIVLLLLPRQGAAWWSDNWRPSYYLFMFLILLSLVPPGLGLPNILGTLIGEPSARIMGYLLGYGG